jgi:tetratricopeptide (TPR) repeat protein/tRNA A-37 threonylcarbamoyl transferase component Bud32
LIPAERWERAKELFDEALAVSTDRRSAFLAEQSGGDETLRQEVESLIASHEQAGAFLDDAAGSGDSRSSPWPGRVGPYRLLDLVGRGGMGDVYRAVRDDDHFKKIVAVKLVRPDIAGELEEHRLRAERQILACLEHPGIARLLDGGSTEDGRPFLAMEYVEGARLDAFAEARGLDVRARVQLVLPVCAAVQHAHQNLVVHRDLKPGNILVTAEGVPKLLDFGVAKLLDPALAGETTATAFPAMTPAYASPEQVRGEPITTATDVYSLGAVLYELVAGVRPHRSTGASLQAAICEQVPERPSLALRTAPDRTTRSASRSVGSDLDAIVLKALRKEPARRYATVEALSDDLRRYLDGLPVTAARGTFSYRTGKFVRRNRLAVGLAVAVLALLAALAATSAVQAARLARERDRAERVTDFLVDLFRVSDPGEARGNTVTAREMLDRGTAQIEAELRDEPEVRARLLDVLGRAHMGLGLYDQAGVLLDRGLGIRRRLPGAESLDVAESLDIFGNSRFAKGDFVGAEAQHREALALRRRLLGAEHVLVAESLTHLGTALRAQRPDSPEAEALFRQAIGIKRRLQGAAHGDLTNPMSELALVLRDKGDLAGAEALLRECVAMRRAKNTDASPQFAAFLNNLGVVLERKGDYQAAETQYRESLAVKRMLHGDGHPSLAVALANLGAVAGERGDYAQAEALQREALSMLRRFLGGEHPRVASFTAALAATVADGGDRTQGEALQREALAMTIRLLGDRHATVSKRLGELARVLKAEGKLSEAEATYRRALDIGRQVLPPAGLEVATMLSGLADVLAEQGDAAAAEPLAREALDIRRRLLPQGHPETAESESVLGAVLGASGSIDEAEPLVRDGHALITSRRGPHARQSRDAALRAARLYERTGPAGRAREYRALAAR